MLGTLEQALPPAGFVRPNRDRKEAAVQPPKAIDTLKKAAIEPKKREQQSKPIAIETRQTTPPPAPPPPNYLALGDQARDSGNYAAALKNYRAANDAGRISALQRAIEGDSEDRAGVLADSGRYNDAIALADQWLREFPSSQRLQKLRAKMVRARDSQ